MNFNDEHNTKSQILSDIITVNHTCNTHTTNNSDYNIYDHELDLDSDNKFFAQQAGNCKYYTDEVLTEEINFTDGILRIHFNCRSIK